MPNFEDLINAAKENRWDFVDEHIAVLANDEGVTAWALNEGLEDADGNVRDLAASVLEKSPASLPEATKTKLLQLMTDDANPYVRFRSAFALYVRGERSPEVITKMQEAEKDSDVSGIAKDYLSGE